MISFRVYCENVEQGNPLFYNHAFIMAPSQPLGLNNTLDLPKGRPYGFWVNKWGHWIQVPMEGHEHIAGQIFNAYNRFQTDPEKKLNNTDARGIDQYYKPMYHNGWVRVHNDWNGGTTFWEHPSRRFQLSPGQQKFFKEINMDYHLPVKRDDWMPEP